MSVLLNQSNYPISRSAEWETQDLIIVRCLSAGAAAAAATVRTSVAAAPEVIDVEQPEARSVTASLCHHLVAFLCLVSKVTVVSLQLMDLVPRRQTAGGSGRLMKWTGYFFSVCVLCHVRLRSWCACSNLPQLILPLIRLIAVNELKVTKWASSCSTSALLRRPKLGGGVSLIGYNELALIGVSFS